MLSVEPQVLGAWLLDLVGRRDRSYFDAVARGLVDTWRAADRRAFISSGEATSESHKVAKGILISRLPTNRLRSN